jgi:hypothetical protein
MPFPTRAREALELYIKRTRLIIALVCCANPVLAQTRGPIEGVWKIVEWVESGRTFTTVQPSLFIFTKGYYSMLFLQTFQLRPPIAAPQTRQNLTDAEKIARFDHWSPFTAASGTYEVGDTTVTLRPIIAKSGWEMSEQAIRSFPIRRQGSDTLVVHFAPALGIRVTLVRVE